MRWFKFLFFFSPALRSVSHVHSPVVIWRLEWLGYQSDSLGWLAGTRPPSLSWPVTCSASLRQSHTSRNWLKLGQILNSHWLNPLAVLSQVLCPSIPQVTLSGPLERVLAVSVTMTLHDRGLPWESQATHERAAQSFTHRPQHTLTSVLCSMSELLWFPVLSRFQF